MPTRGTDYKNRLVDRIHGALVPAVATLFSICVVMVQEISQRHSSVFDALFSAVGYVGAVGLGGLLVCMTLPRSRFRQRIVWSMCVVVFILVSAAQKQQGQSGKDRGVLDSLVNDVQRDLHLEPVALQQSAPGGSLKAAPQAQVLTMDQWLQKSTDAAQMAGSRLQTAMATYDLGQPFAPEVIASTARMRAVVDNAKRQIAALSQYISETDAILAQSRREISNVQASEHARAQLAIGFEKSSNGIPEMKRLVGLQQDQLYLVIALENLLLREQGRYRVEGGRPMFTSNEAMSEYNTTVQKLGALDDRVESASEEIKTSYNKWKQQLELTTKTVKDIR